MFESDSFFVYSYNKVKVLARQPAVSISISKPKLLEWRGNGLTHLTLGLHARLGVCQPPLSFAVFDLSRLSHRYGAFV